MQPTRAIVVGQPDVVSKNVEDQLRQRVPRVDRLGGDDRYATSAAVIADAFPNHTEFALVATGLDYPDALAAATTAAYLKAPVAIVPGACIANSVLHELDRLAPDEVFLLGGQDVVAPAVGSGAPCDGPCPSTSIPLERASAPDARLCLAFEIRGNGLAWSKNEATFTAQNRSAQPVTITHPSSCPLFFGRFDKDTGRFVGQGPEACTQTPTQTTLAAGETRAWHWDQDTGTDDGEWIFAAGLDVAGSGVWYARDRDVWLGAP
jgi:hypothetical protein